MTTYRTFALVLSASGAVLCSSVSASAGNYDGPWSMVAVTTHGHCGTVDIGLAVTRGRLQATSGMFAFYPISISGRVSASGQVRLSAVAGPRVARGTGRFGRQQGSGTWSGRGPSGLCSGVWRASRA